MGLRPVLLSFPTRRRWQHERGIDLFPGFPGRQLRWRRGRSLVGLGVLWVGFQILPNPHLVHLAIFRHRGESPQSASDSSQWMRLRFGLFVRLVDLLHDYGIDQHAPNPPLAAI